MPASTPVTKARERIKAILDGVSGFSSARIKLGNVNLADDNTFFSTLVSAGPYVTVGRAKFGRSGPSSASHYEFDVDVHFWFGWADDEDQTFVAIEDLLATAVAALNTKSNWVGQDCMMPLDLDVDEAAEDSGKPRKLHYTVTMNFGRNE